MLPSAYVKYVTLYKQSILLILANPPKKVTNISKTVSYTHLTLPTNREV